MALSLETCGLTVEAQHMYLELIAKEQRGSGTGHVSQDELETWEVPFAALNAATFIENTSMNLMSASHCYGGDFGDILGGVFFWRV